MAITATLRAVAVHFDPSGRVSVERTTEIVDTVTGMRELRVVAVTDPLKIAGARTACVNLAPATEDSITAASVPLTIP